MATTASTAKNTSAVKTVSTVKRTHSLRAHRVIQTVIPLLRPAVTHREHQIGRRAFRSSAAGLPLSSVASMSFVRGTDMTPLSQRVLDEAHLSVREVWDHAANNLIAAAMTPGGVEFYTRPAHKLIGERFPEGFQVRARSYPISSWLAHPRTFTILHRHLAELLATHELCYVVVNPSVLLVFPQISSEEAARIVGRVRHLEAAASTRHILTLKWASGFPHEFPLGRSYRAA